MIRDGIDKVENRIISFLMIGQSNMAGRGEFGQVPPIENEKCHMLRMGRWQPMSEPINTDRDILNNEFHSGIGLAASFADEFAKYTGQDVGLIPCADGGTKLCQWMPGEILFDHAVFMTKLALRTSQLGGILWHQGESDCNAEDVKTYKKRFIRMITELRRQVGAEELPLIIGELSENITPGWNCGEYPPVMNRIFHEIAEELPYCRAVSSKGLTLKPDGIHFDSISCREFGKRYFETFQKVSER